MEFDSPESGVIVSNQACVVYDASSGEVLHIHEIAALEGGYVPSEAELVERALELAKTSTDLGAKRVEALVVDPQSVAEDRKFRVDLGTKRLVTD
jgi:hypothetical protein